MGAARQLSPMGAPVVSAAEPEQLAEVIELRPQPGPQEQFLATEADICVFGGAAGGGKSYACTIDPLGYVDVPGFTAAMFRRTSSQITGAGSLWDEAQGIYHLFGGVSREGKHLDWRWPSGAVIQYHHLQHEKDKLSHQGKHYCGIYFDELTHFTESQFWYLVSRNRSTCGVRPYVRATCNPDPDSWVKKLIAWWLDDDGFAIPERSGVLRYFVRVADELVWSDSAEDLKRRYPEVTTALGVEPKSFTFIASSLQDNQILMNADPGYMANLLALPLVEREQLLKGNWKIRPAAGLYFRREWFEVIDAIPAGEVRRWVRGWDLAASKVTDQTPDPDFTASVLIAELRNGTYVIADMIEFRGSPGEVENAMVNTASQDGRKVGVALWQDPGAAGLADAKRKVGLLKGYRARAIPAALNKVKYAGPLSAQVEAGNVKVLRADWNERFYSVFQAFPEGPHDDQVDAASRAFLELTRKSAAWMDDMAAAAVRA